MRIIFRALLACALSLPWTGSCAAAGGKHLSLAFTSDVNGYLKDCGCHAKKLGGMDRRQYIVDSLRQRIGEDLFLLVDAGNLRSYKQDAATGRETAFLLRLMARQRYDAIVMGPKDFTQPDSLRQALLGATSLPWIGSNLKDEARPAGVQSVWTRKVDGIKVGLFSYIDPAWTANNLAQDVLVDNLESTAKELAATCDLVVLVAHTEVNQPEALARRVEGLVDLMILGGVSSPLLTPKREGSVTIGNCGDRGRYIARFDLLFDAKKQLVATDYQVTEVNMAVPQDRVVAGLMEDFDEEQLSIQRARLEALRLDKLAQLKIDPASLPGAGSPLSYVGEKDCRDCHSAQHNSWRQTPHGHAFSDLIRSRESDQELKLKRTVTGWMEGSGFVDRKESTHLYNVQCESCHGRGSEHVKSKGAALETLAKPESSCLSCHGPDSSPAFDLQAGLKRVHPPLPATEAPQPGASSSTALPLTPKPGEKLKLEGKTSTSGQQVPNRSPGAPVVPPTPPSRTPAPVGTRRP